MTATAAPAPSLTDHDRRVIAKAGAVAALRGLEVIREHSGTTDTAMAYAIAFGEAQNLLAELAAIIERLGGGNDS